jgi:signal transduction histidine kinase
MESIKEKSKLIQLHKDIAVYSNENQPLEKALHKGLKRICEETGWPVGHIYFTAEDSSDGMIPSVIWHLEDQARFETFRNVTENSPLAPGVGLPGRVMASGKPAWIQDVTKDANFPRAKMAEDIGVRAGFAFPIFIGQEVVGVMEFFSASALEPDEEILESMENIGTQIGRVLERRKADEKQKDLLHNVSERIKELTCIYEITNLIRNCENVEDIFEKAAIFMAQAWQYPEITRTKIYFDGKEYCPNPFEETLWKQVSEITIKGELRGTIETFYLEEMPDVDEGPFLKEERSLIEGISRLLGEAYEKKLGENEVVQSRKQLRDLSQRLELIREEERTRIAREVHDELGQVLSTLKLELSLFGKKWGVANKESNQQIVHMTDLIDNTIQTVKRISADLRPPILDFLGVGEAIEWQGKEFEKRTNIKFKCEINLNSEEIDQNRATTLFRIFQETLTNISRHAEANNIFVNLSKKDKNFILIVEDDGIGITEEQVSNPKSLGILGMRERALVWGGTVEFLSQTNQGAKVVITISM